MKFAFATGDADNVRLLPYDAAQSVAWGLPRDDAIRAMTIERGRDPRRADRVGSIEPGKIANLFIANGDPLEVRTASPTSSSPAATCRSTTNSWRSTSAT